VLAQTCFIWVTLTVVSVAIFKSVVSIINFEMVRPKEMRFSVLTDTRRCSYKQKNLTTNNGVQNNCQRHTAVLAEMACLSELKTTCRFWFSRITGESLLFWGSNLQKKISSKKKKMEGPRGNSNSGLNDLATAVFSAPWKTPSQYAAYVGSVQRALNVTQHRRRHNEEMVSRMTMKSATDVYLAAQQEDISHQTLKSRDHHRRHIAKMVSKNATASLSLASIPKRASTPQPQSRVATTTARVMAPSVATPPPLAQRRSNDGHKVSMQPPTTGAAQLHSSVPLNVSPSAVSPSNAERVKVSSRQGHYVFEDEVGLIDIDEGDSDRDGTDDDNAESLPPHDDSDVAPPDVSNVTQQTSGEGDEGHSNLSDEDEGEAIIMDETRLLAFMFQLDEETDKMVGDILDQCNPRDRVEMQYSGNNNNVQEHLDWSGGEKPRGSPSALCRPSSQATTRREISAAASKRSGSASKYNIDQTKSIAVYMSSLRPNGYRAVVEIEEARRKKMEQQWKEVWDSIFGDCTRSTAARRIKDHSTNRNSHVVMEQEAAARISMISRYHAATERLKRDEVLMAQKILRMAKFRGRLNAKEDSIFRDDALQKETLDQLAHKMLERVMRSHDQNDDSDVLVDNTDPWEGGRRRQSSSAGAEKIRRLSTALKAGGLLNQFYDGQRRRSTMQRRASVAPTTDPSGAAQETSQLMPAVSFAFDNAGSPPPRHDRRVSTWALPSVKERSKSLAFVVPISGTPPEVVVAQVGNAAEADEDHRKRNAARLKATEARWEQDAKKLAAALQRELLQKCRPDFGKTYDERIVKIEAPFSSSTIDSPITPGDAALSGFTFGEPSASPSAHSGSSAMPREAPQRSAVITIANTNFGKEDSSRTPDNPIALALKQRKDDALMRNDERLQRYRQATNRQNLTHAVDAVIQGKVGRVTDFQEMAGMHRSSQKVTNGKVSGTTSGGARPSAVDDRNSEYLVDRQPTHTNFDVSGKISDLVNGKPASTSEHPPLSSWLSMAAFKLDHPAEHHAQQGSNDQLRILRKASMARMRSMDNSELVDNSRASFAQFSQHDATDADPAFEFPGLSRRRSSAFFQPAATQKHLRSDQPDVIMRASSPPQIPDEIALNNECHWIGGVSKNSSTTTDRSASDLQATLRRRRSNVAALLVTSGLGRHDVVETRKSGNGDTVLYAKQRARNSNTLKPSSGAHDPSTLGDHSESYEESPKFVSWGSQRGSDDGAVRRGKPRVQFSNHGNDAAIVTVGTPAGPGTSTTESTASSSSPAYELINPTTPQTASASAGVPMFMWDVQVSTHDNTTAQVVDSEDDDDLAKSEGDRLTVSLRRASSILGRGGKPTVGHARSTPQVSTDRKKLRSPGYTPDTWCLDAEDFQ
jgi:hypothetical protein